MKSGSDGGHSTAQVVGAQRETFTPGGKAEEFEGPVSVPQASLLPSRQAIEVDGKRVSSTYVRKQLEAANFPLVERLLGRPYAIAGEVVEGRKLGSDLGFPTCNVNLHRQRIPLHGVYACEVELDGKCHAAAVNIGYRPTVTEEGEALLEAHLLDFSGDLYGRQLEVIFRHKIRDEEKYESLDVLKKQIALDVAQVRQFFAEQQA